MRLGGVLFLLAISVASVRAASPEAIKEVAAELVCLCGDCARESLATCLCGFATQQREDIGNSLDGGKTAQETIDEYVSEYGQMVLASPPAEGVNLLAWITPFAALVFGVFLIRSILRNRMQEASPTPTVETAQRDRLQRELERFDEDD
ncbi:MAG: cytochrome c-type biogenesis protein CcmH [Candidatus Latescibacterota bacterium]|nr:cytochrome c-type biogenesis protein CcmH [Candidatus Latescibacterota bacterium]